MKIITTTIKAQGETCQLMSKHVCFNHCYTPHPRLSQRPITAEMERLIILMLEYKDNAQHQLERTKERPVIVFLSA